VNLGFSLLRVSSNELLRISSLQSPQKDLDQSILFIYKGIADGHLGWLRRGKPIAFRKV
jgi:hypothetical protein